MVSCREVKAEGKVREGGLYLVQSEDTEMKYTKQLGKQCPPSQNREDQVKLIKALCALSHSVLSDSL